MSADLTHIDTWLFDLDNTLYPAESGFMAAIVDRMTDFVEKVTGLPRDQAYALQKTYLAEHGLTLKGMMIHHGVDPQEFHAIFHDMSLEALAHDPDLLAALERLPGRRLIFTNADAVHAERVLARLGLAHLFDDVFHIGSAGYEPKPSVQAFERITAAHAVDPAATAFFEDSERNLAPAHDLGMTTVLVGPWAAQSTAPFVHHRTDKLAPFLANARLREAA
ncbi:pyrimidine 5'-nucleotidase [Phenylobacterium sp. VNQ135]|uniref:pyrimidine 5'-nucleotidase n=1 Tax=Phenylobacterium sp. VNQ135 TaxID=3400922 RepID=UPI003C033508